MTIAMKPITRKGKGDKRVDKFNGIPTGKCKTCRPNTAARQYPYPGTTVRTRKVCAIEEPEQIDKTED